jgi:hypothetical protein
MHMHAQAGCGVRGRMPPVLHLPNDRVRSSLIEIRNRISTPRHDNELTESDKFKYQMKLGIPSNVTFPYNR